MLPGHERANLFPQFLEESLLIIQHRGHGTRAMSRANDLRAEFPGRLECLHPFAHVPIAHIIVRPVDADIPRIEDSLFGEPSHRISVRMRNSQVHHLDAMFAVVKDQLSRV